MWRCIISILIMTLSIYSQPADSIRSDKNNLVTKYLFYLHGRIVEDQGPNAVSEEYGPYEYDNIVSTLVSKGYKVISEVREKNCDPLNYAEKVTKQIDSLLHIGIPANNITVLGASKGAFIAIQVSDLVQNKEVNYVLIAIFSESIAEILKKTNVKLSGRVLHVYDYKDVLSASGEKFINEFKGKEFSDFKEVELKMGLGHGILYKPYDEWINLLLKWSNPEKRL